MGEVLDPKPPQWRRKESEPEQKEDRVIALSVGISRLFGSEADNPVTQLSSLKLVQKTIIAFIVKAYGSETAKEALRQADELVNQYDIVDKG